MLIETGGCSELPETEYLLVVGRATGFGDATGRRVTELRRGKLNPSLKHFRGPDPNNSAGPSLGTSGTDGNLQRDRERYRALELPVAEKYRSHYRRYLNQLHNTFDDDR